MSSIYRPLRLQKKDKDKAARSAMAHKGHRVVDWDCGCSFGCGQCAYSYRCIDCGSVLLVNPNSAAPDKETHK